MQRHARPTSISTPRHSVTENDKPNTVAHSFFSGVMVLSVSTIIVKIIGLFYKIPMLRYLGSVGMGYFNAAYEWFAMLSAIAGAGLPIAVSMLIARARATHTDAGRRRRAIRRIERLSMRIFFLFGVVGSLLLFFGAGWVASLLDSPLTAYSLRAVAPTMFFSCLSASYRGYFQGFQNMKPTAISQLIEAVGKLVLGLCFARYAIRIGMDVAHVAAFAMLGLSLGVALAAVYLAVCRLMYRSESIEQDPPPQTMEAPLPQNVLKPRRSTAYQLIAIAIPVTLSAAVLSLTKLVDMTMILRRLQSIGYSTTEANALYGVYTTMAIPVFNLIPSLLTSVSLALIPTLSSQIGTGDHAAQSTTVISSLRITALLSLPASLALCVYSHPILSLLFHAEESQLSSAAPMLSFLGLSVVFSGLITTTNAILQTYHRAYIPILSMLAGSLIKLISAYFLISIPSLNILGAPISSFLCNIVIVWINLYAMQRHCHLRPDLPETLIKPFGVSMVAVALPAAAVAYLVGKGVSEIPLFAVAVPITLVLQVALTVRFGLLDVPALTHSTLGRRMYHMLNRVPVLKKAIRGRIENES